MQAENPFGQLSAESPEDSLAMMESQEFFSPLGDDVSEFFGCDEPEECDNGEPQGSHDLSDDADALASAGHGMDEDYCHNTVEDNYLEMAYEDRTDLGDY